jgi:hypothetical protein
MTSSTTSSKRCSRTSSSAPEGGGVKFAICFDFPEAPGEPLFAGWAGNGTPGFAPTLATAMRFDEWDVAERFLANSYGPSVGECGAVVEVAA